MARALAWVTTCGVIYASLYPFEGWRDSGWGLADWLLSPWPRYWTARDLWLNWLGYVPLGFLWAWAGLRPGRGWQTALKVSLQTAAISLALESLQGFLDSRVSSNVDWAFNALGGLTGALTAWWLNALIGPRAGLASRGAWLQDDCGFEFALLVLWLMALVAPMAMPFAVGRWPDSYRLIEVVQWLAPALQELVQQRVNLTQAQESMVMGVTLLSPIALINLVVRGWQNKLWCALALLILAVSVPTLVMAVSHGLSYAGTWLRPSVPMALVFSSAAGVLILGVPASWRWPVAASLLASHAVLVNAFAHTVYWDLEWRTFISGPSARTHGALAWVAAAWPLLALGLLIVRALRRRTNRPV